MNYGCDGAGERNEFGPGSLWAALHESGMRVPVEFWFVPRSLELMSASDHGNWFENQEDDEAMANGWCGGGPFEPPNEDNDPADWWKNGNED